MTHPDRRGERNPMYGKHHTPETRAKLSIVKWGQKNPNWKGDEAKYGSVHIWINRNVPKPTTCQKCKLPKKLEAHNISGQYRREASDWVWVCRACHQEIDGRREMLQERMRHKHWKGVA